MFQTREQEEDHRQDPCLAWQTDFVYAQMVEWGLPEELYPAGAEETEIHLVAAEAKCLGADVALD